MVGASRTEAPRAVTPENWAAVIRGLCEQKSLKMLYRKAEVAATDYVRLYADQIRPLVSRRYVVLGTDGFGRSDRRSQLRHFFEVDRRFIALAALKALADEGTIPAGEVSAAMRKLEIDPEKPDPTRV